MEESLKNQNKKKNIIKKYNSTSYFYDKRYRVIQSEKYEVVLTNYRINDKIILDMGCGTGLLFEYITKLNIHRSVIRFNYVAVDISWNMLLEFKSKVNKIDIKKKSLNLILSDMEYLPFRENSFDSVFSLTSFQNLPNIKNGIVELFRVSKHMADFKFSILKKNIEIRKIVETLKLKIEDLNITKKENLEDIVIQGNISKV